MYLLCTVPFKPRCNCCTTFCLQVYPESRRKAMSAGSFQLWWFYPRRHLATSGDISGHPNGAGRCYLLVSSEQRPVAHLQCQISSTAEHFQPKSLQPSLKNPGPVVPFFARCAEYDSIQSLCPTSTCFWDRLCVSIVPKAVTAKPTLQWTLPSAFVLFETLFLEDEEA